MKNLFIILCTILSLGILRAEARDDLRNFSIKDALATDEAKAVLGDSIKFYFGNEQPQGRVTKEMSEYRFNRKTNAANKSDIAACQWVFLTVLKELRDVAQREGANAVINIRSNYKNNLTSSNETFVCGAGTLIAGVALVGDLVVVE